MDNVPGLGEALRKLHEAATYRGPQPEFLCGYCAKIERSGHFCPPKPTNVNAQRRLIEGLDKFAQGRRAYDSQDE